VLRCEALEPFARHLFTTRNLAFRERAPSPEYDRVAGALGTHRDGVVTVTQVHGRVVSVIVPGQWDGMQCEADAIVTTDPALALTVRVADCVPIVIADRHRRVVAVVHAGWRGTVAEVARATVREIAALGIPAPDLVAAIGPSIGPCCYQVDAAVRDAFIAVRADAERWFVPEADELDSIGRAQVSRTSNAERRPSSRHWKLDLWRANADQLIEAGLEAGNVHIARLCTLEHPGVCWSFRGQGPTAGRMVAAVTAKPVTAKPRA
jgi:YfiH family protein